MASSPSSYAVSPCLLISFCPTRLDRVVGFLLPSFVKDGLHDLPVCINDLATLGRDGWMSIPVIYLRDRRAIADDPDLAQRLCETAGRGWMYRAGVRRRTMYCRGAGSRRRRPPRRRRRKDGPNTGRGRTRDSLCTKWYSGTVDLDTAVRYTPRD